MIYPISHIFCFLVCLSYPSRSDECNESQRYLASVDSENIDITSDPTGLAVEGDANDHTVIQENWQKFEQGRIGINEPISVINLGTKENPKNLKIGENLSEEMKKGLSGLLAEYLDVFAWSYEDMPGLDQSIVVHHLSTQRDMKPKKQKFRRFRPDILLKIKEEVKKLLEVGFIEVSNYP